MNFVSSTQWHSDPVWEVKELTQYIRQLFEVDFNLQDVSVSGELSNFSQARSGHLYFTLKDADSQLKCVMWRNAAEQLPFLPADGDAVVVHGRVTIYEATGVYQLYVERLEPVGRGDLAVAFEALKQQLADEGLFEAHHKKPIPAFPRKIGIVTSADAAALRDILNVLRRRYPLVEVLIVPTLVQGHEAPQQIIRALEWVDGRDDIDTILLARGGGSVEDLWAFNDEGVARTIFAARHPIISGVGHEIDFTIADFVADLRAPTPSAAAELAVPDVADLAPYVHGLAQLLQTAVADRLQQQQHQLHSLTRALSHLSPRGRLENNWQRLDYLHGRLEQATQRLFAEKQAQLQLATVGLTAVGPVATLGRGYAIVRRANGRLLRSVDGAEDGERLTIQLADGDFNVIVQK